MTYHYLVSLGHGCQPAHHAIRAGLHKVSLPMDWLGDACLHQEVIDKDNPFAMPHDLPTGYVKLIEDDFVGLWNAEDLEVTIVPEWKDNPQKVVDTKYDVGCVHEFEVGHVYDNIERVQMMFDRRVRRFRSVMRSGGPVLFIRTMFTERNSRLMSEMLRRKYPDLQFTLLVVNRTHECQGDWDIPNVVKMNVDFAPDWLATSQDYDSLWDGIFAGFEFDLKEIEL
jgi:hypothetical protein